MKLKLSEINKILIQNHNENLIVNQNKIFKKLQLKKWNKTESNTINTRTKMNKYHFIYKQEPLDYSIQINGELFLKKDVKISEIFFNLNPQLL